MGQKTTTKTWSWKTTTPQLTVFINENAMKNVKILIYLFNA